MMYVHLNDLNIFQSLLLCTMVNIYKVNLILKNFMIFKLVSTIKSQQSSYKPFYFCPRTFEEI